MFEFKRKTPAESTGHSDNAEVTTLKKTPHIHEHHMDMAIKQELADNSPKKPLLLRASKAFATSSRLINS